jgi:hypothetical protein
MLTTQGQGGLYAGPTSAAAHLITVGLFRVPFDTRTLILKSKNEDGSSEEPIESRHQSIDRADVSAPEYDDGAEEILGCF